MKRIPFEIQERDLTFLRDLVLVTLGLYCFYVIVIEKLIQ